MHDRLKKIAAVSGLRDTDLGALDAAFLDEEWDPAKYEVRLGLFILLLLLLLLLLNVSADHKLKLHIHCSVFLGFDGESVWR